MITTEARIEELVREASALEPWVGAFDAGVLRQWLRLELGEADALDRWFPYGAIHARAVPLSPILHVVSGNTPHAAFQSVFRGLLAGCFNRVKLPSRGLPEFESWLESAPPSLKSRIVARRELPDEWLESEAAVIFGNRATLDFFRNRLKPEVRRIEHGPKLGIAVVFEPGPDAARHVAEDILRFNQTGCLSVQAVYVAAEYAGIHRFGDDLALAMDQFRRRHPRRKPSLSESGSIANLREMIRFRLANGEDLRLWESAHATDWTIVFDPDPRLEPGPLNGFVRLHPFPEMPAPDAFGPEVTFLSGVSIFPFNEQTAGCLEMLGPPRICAAGTAQEPTVFWHHDGLPTLASLVRWRNLG
jgi:hypothetical protein